jgi:hypothetical protein
MDGRPKKMPPDEDYEKFQQMVWGKLPMRKWLAGREKVYDCISVVVQEWPDDGFALADSGHAAETPIIKSLMADVRRHLHLAYGEQEFGFIWTIILQAVLYEVILMILEWWRNKKTNRMALLKWQKHWRNRGE